MIEPIKYSDELPEHKKKYADDVWEITKKLHERETEMVEIYGPDKVYSALLDRMIVVSRLLKPESFKEIINFMNKEVLYGREN